MPGFGNRASINRYDQDLRKMGDFGGFKRLDWDLKKYAKSPNLCRFWIDFDHVEKNCHVLPILYPSSPCSSMSCVRRPGLASILAIRWRRVRRSLRHVEPLLLSTARRVGPQKGWKIPVKFAANDWGRFPTILIVVMYSSKVRVKTVQVACLHEKIHYLKSNVFYCLNMNFAFIKTSTTIKNNSHQSNPKASCSVTRPAWAGVGTWRFKTSSVPSSTFCRKAVTGPFCWLDIRKDVAAVGGWWCLPLCNALHVFEDS